MKTRLNKQCTKGKRVSSEQNNLGLGNADLSSTSNDSEERINHRVLLLGLKKRNYAKIICNEYALNNTT